MKKIIIFLALLFVPFISSATIDTNLYYGLKNNSKVKELQEFLISKELLIGPATGNFYSLTLSAVKKYQSNIGVVRSGYVGPLTRKSINDELTKNGGKENISASTPEPEKKSTDTMAILKSQIALLQKQLDALNTQSQGAQQSNQQLQQQIQQIQQDTSQIAQNTTPPVTPAAVPVTASNISIQSNYCNLVQSNLKTEYTLNELLSGGNSDGRIFINAYVINSVGQNYYNTNPSNVMTITTSDHSNDKTLHGSGNTGPCGFHYPYEFYATKVGTYTITYSIPSLNLSKTITINVKSSVEQPVISSYGFTISTSEKETDYPLSEIDNFPNANIKYWFQSSKPTYKYTLSAWCSDSDTPSLKIEMVSSLGKDGLYYYRGYFAKGGQFSGNTTCKFIHSTNSPIVESSESDSVMFQVK